MLILSKEEEQRVFRNENGTDFLSKTGCSHSQVLADLAEAVLTWGQTDAPPPARCGITGAARLSVLFAESQENSDYTPDPPEAWGKYQKLLGGESGSTCGLIIGISQEKGKPWFS